MKKFIPIILSGGISSRLFPRRISVSIEEKKAWQIKNESVYLSFDSNNIFLKPFGNQSFFKKFKKETYLEKDDIIIFESINGSLDNH